MFSALIGDCILHEKISKGMQLLPLLQLLQCIHADLHLDSSFSWFFIHGWIMAAKALAIMDSLMSGQREGGDFPKPSPLPILAPPGFLLTVYGTEMSHMKTPTCKGDDWESQALQESSRERGLEFKLKKRESENVRGLRIDSETVIDYRFWWGTGTSEVKVLTRGN